MIFKVIPGACNLSLQRVSGCSERFDYFRKLCKGKSLDESIKYLSLTIKQGPILPPNAILFLLQECTTRKDASACRQLHSLITNSELGLNDRIREHLVRMFASSGSLEEATQVFSELLQPSLYVWNAIISAYASSGQCEKALEYFYAMQHKGIEPVKITILNLLKACISTQSITWGRLVHEATLKKGLESNTNFGNMLVNMYSKCNSMEDAYRVFERLPHPDIVSWGTIISGYAMHGHSLRALSLFEEMHEKGIMPNIVVFLSILKACLSLGGLVKGSQAHDQIIRSGLESDVVLGSTLIDMYSKSGSLEEAHLLFDRLQDANVVSWGSIIAGYVQHGLGISALELFEQMKQEGLNPDNFIFSCVFKACGKRRAVGKGRLIHIQIIYCRLKLDVVVGNSLIDMYAKCGSLEAAHRVFDEMLNRDVVSWGALIAGYVQHGHGQSALELYKSMQQVGLKPDMFTSSCLLKACGAMGSLKRGRLIHEQIIRRGCTADVITGNALVDMYAKCGSLEDAQKLFDNLRNPDVVSWDAMIAGSIQHGKSHYALELFIKMQEKGIEPDEITFLSILKACGSVVAIKQGRLLHDQIIRKGFKSDVIVGNALIDMYAKCGSLEEGRKVFDDLPKRVVVSWGVMIAGYAQHGHIASALELLHKMHEESVVVDSITFLCILKACSKMRAIKQGRLMHDWVIVNGLHVDLVINNALIDMYAKCGSLGEAHRVFDILPDRNVVTWDAIITGYVQHGHGLPALELWGKMCQEGMKPIKVTFLCTLKACCSIGAIEQGRLLHDHILESGFETHVSISNTLIDMYAKCGSLEDANQVFDKLLSPDLVSWSVIIAGHARYGNYILARQCLEDLQGQGLKPNDEIYLGLLGACRQVGLVKEARWFLKSMSEDHGIIPCLEHCSCMVDLLGNAGCLKEAANFIWAMPCEPDTVVWTSLLASSRLHGNVELGNYCFDKLVELNRDDASVYVLMWKMYADADMQEDADKLEELRKLAGAQKKPGVAWIEDSEEVHEFVVRSSGHLQEDEAYVKVKSLSVLVREEGYVPQVDSVMEPMFMETEQDIICSSDSYGTLAVVHEPQHVQDDNFMHFRSVCAC